MRPNLPAFEQFALQADHPAQFDHSADLSVAIDFGIEAAAGKFSEKRARRFSLDGVANTHEIPRVDDHESLFDEVDGMNSSIEGKSHESITGV